MGGLDDVTIFDGSNSDSDLIERKSGNHRSFGISSNGHEMYLELDSGDFKYDNENGFLATFYYGKRTLMICYIVFSRRYFEITL